MQAIISGWTLPRGALYFVTPSSRARPVKVDVLSNFMADRLSRPPWRWPR
jgi:hypothetical protein